MKQSSFAAFEKYLKQASPFPALLLVHSKIEGEAEWLARELLNRCQPGVSVKCTELDEESLSMLLSPSLFSKKEIYLIPQAEKAGQGAVKALKSHFSSPILSCEHVLFLAATSLRKDSVLYKLADEKGAILDLSEEKAKDREKRLSEWIQEVFKAEGKKISSFLCEALLKRLAADPQLVKQEVQKLLCFVGDRNEVLENDLKAVSSVRNQETVWQWGEALIKKDKAAALRIGRALLSDGDSLIALLNGARRQFQTAFQVRSLLESGGHTAIQEAFPYMKGWVLENQIKLSQSRSEESYKSALLAFDEVDRLFRTGVDDPAFLIDFLTIKLL